MEKEEGERDMEQGATHTHTKDKVVVVHEFLAKVI